MPTPKAKTTKSAEKKKPVEEEIKDQEILMDDSDVDIADEDFPIEKELASKPDRYFEAVGRRKTAVARIRLFTKGEKEFLVNGKKYQDY